MKINRSVLFKLKEGHLVPKEFLLSIVYLEVVSDVPASIVYLEVVSDVPDSIVYL